MKSRYYDKFNHDEDAPEYDRDVLDEGNPIRTGYSALLEWTAEIINARKPLRIIELGTGSGNLTAMLEPCERIDAVDISGGMLQIAEKKLVDRKDINFIKQDLLEYFDSAPSADAVVSTYALHHLTDEEKVQLSNLIFNSLGPSGFAVIGDLGFESTVKKNKYYSCLRANGNDELVNDIEDEFFWDVESAKTMVTAVGFTVQVKKFSELSWGFYLGKGAPVS